MMLHKHSRPPTGQAAPDTAAGTPGTPARAWREPAELRRYIPRQVTLSAAGYVVLTCAAALLVGALAGGAALYSSYKEGRALIARIDREAVPTESIVQRTGRTGGESKRRFADYRFTVDGRSMRGRVTLHKSDRRYIAPGTVLPVRYLPSDPRRNWVPGYEPSGPPLAAVVVVPILMAASSWALFELLRRQRSLLAHGRVAEGRMLLNRKKRLGSGCLAEYEFRILSGATRHLKIRSEKPIPDGPATVLYDRDNPRICARYPLSLVHPARRIT